MVVLVLLSVIVASAVDRLGGHQVGIRHHGAAALELRRLGRRLDERQLERISTGLVQVGQIALGCRPRDVQLRELRPPLVQRRPGDADLAVLALELSTQPQYQFVGRSHIVPQSREPRDVVVELRRRRRHRGSERGPLGAGLHVVG